MAKKQDLLEFVPEAFRQGGDPDILANIALLNLINEGADINTQLGYITGLKNHNNLVTDETKNMASDSKPGQGWRWYSDVIRDVKIVERKKKDSSFVLGRKAQILFESSSDEFIETGWIEFNIPISDLSVHWEMALSRTIMKIAQDSIGKKASILKHVWTEGGNNKGGRRMCIDLKVYNDPNAPTNNAPSNEPEEITLKAARVIGKSLKIDYDEFLPEMKNLIAEINEEKVIKKSDVYDFVADSLDIDYDLVKEKADLDNFDNYEESGADWQLLALGMQLLDDLFD